MPASTITLNDGDKAVLERIAGDAYVIRHYENGKDVGLFKNSDDGKPVRLDANNPTLIISGDIKTASLQIPGNIAIDPHDFIPHITNNASQPVNILGGGEFVAEPGAQPLNIAISPVSRNAIGLTVNAEATEKDNRLADDARIFAYKDDRGQTRRFVIDNNGGDVQMTSADNNPIILSGRESVAQQKERLKSPDDAPAPELQKAAPRATSMSADEMTKFRNAATQLLQLSENMRDATGNLVAEGKGELASSLKTAGLAAKDATGGMLMQDKENAFRAALDKAITTAEKVSNGKDSNGKNVPMQDLQAATGLLSQLQKIKKDLPKSKQVSMAPDMAALASAANVHSSIMGQQGNNYAEGSDVSASAKILPQTTELSNDRSV